MPRRPLPAWLTPPVALVVLVALLSAFVLTYAMDTTRATTEDEIWAIIGGRLMETDLRAWVFDTVIFNRGPERLTSLLFAAVNAVVPGVPGEFRVMHVIVTVAYFAAAFPLFWIGRRLGLTPWLACATAALGVAGPWMVFGATFLNTALGFPLTVLTAWAALRAATEPALRNDLLLVAVGSLNTLARTSHVAYAAVGVLGVMYALWLRRPAGEPVGRSLALFVPRFARAHPVLFAPCVAVLLFVVAAGPERLAGSAYDTGEPADLGFAWAELYERLAHWYSQLALTTGVIPYVVGAAWALREVVRPQDRATGTFAFVFLGLFLVFVYITGSHNSTIEERYVAPLGGLPLVAFAVALVRRRMWVPGTVVLAVLAAIAIVDQVGGVAPVTAFDFVTAPSRFVYTQAAVGRLTEWTGLGVDVAEIAIMVPVAAACVAVAVLLNRARRPAAGVPALLGALAVFLFASGAWVLERYEPATFPERSLGGVARVDAVAGDRPGAAFLYRYAPPERDALRFYLANTVYTFNRSTCCNIWVNDLPTLIAPDGRLPGDQRPTHLVRFAGFDQIGFDTTPVERTGYFGTDELGTDAIRVERFDGPPLAAFSIGGADWDGSLLATSEARVAVYEPTRRRTDRCAAIDVAAPDADARLRWRAGGRTGTVALRAATMRTVFLPVAGVEAITITGAGAAERPLRLGEAALARCDAATARATRARPAPSPPTPPA